jgi:hypothetical protein
MEYPNIMPQTSFFIAMHKIPLAIHSYGLSDFQVIETNALASTNFPFSTLRRSVASLPHMRIGFHVFMGRASVPCKPSPRRHVDALHAKVSSIQSSVTLPGQVTERQ